MPIPMFKHYCVISSGVAGDVMAIEEWAKGRVLRSFENVTPTEARKLAADLIKMADATDAGEYRFTEMDSASAAAVVREPSMLAAFEGTQQ